MEPIQFEISEQEQGQRLDIVLSYVFPQHSRTIHQRLIHEGKVWVNEETVKPSYRVMGGDNVIIDLPSDNLLQEYVPAQHMALDVMYEDEYIAIINKPAGVVMHPGYGNEDGTLVNALLARFPKIADVGARERAGLVQRLDKETSGVLIVTLNEDAYFNMRVQFQSRQIKKIYWGLVEGHPPTEKGRIEAPIARDPKNRKRMAVVSEGRKAFTEFYTLEQYPKHTLLKLRIETGRTHQIRVHTAFIGNPIVADKTYGVAKKTVNLNRMFLHAKILGFMHPATGEPMQFEAQLPPELEQVLSDLRQQHNS